MWDKDSIYFLSHTEFGAHHLTLNTKAFYDTFKNDLRAFDDATFSTQRKNQALIAITATTPMGLALI